MNITKEFQFSAEIESEWSNIKRTKNKKRLVKYLFTFINFFFFFAK